MGGAGTVRVAGVCGRAGEEVVHVRGGVARVAVKLTRADDGVAGLVVRGDALEQLLLAYGVAGEIHQGLAVKNDFTVSH